jgi:hypothetical protein
VDALRTPVRRALWAGAVALGVGLPAVRMAWVEMNGRALGLRWCTASGAVEPACRDGVRDHHRVCARMVWGRGNTPEEPAVEQRAEYVTCVLSHPNRYARSIRSKGGAPAR